MVTHHHSYNKFLFNSYYTHTTICLIYLYVLFIYFKNLRFIQSKIKVVRD